MLRGVEVDLETSRDAIPPLLEAYARDLKAEAISNDVIRLVSGIVKSLRAALDKTANEVAKRYGTGQKNPPYFPLVTDAATFEQRLDQNIRGLRANHPKIADAFRDRQPFQPGLEDLKHLPALYRVEAHHDFNLQTRNESLYVAMIVNGMVVMAIGPHGMSIGGAPKDAVVINQSFVGNPQEFAALQATVLDWHFTDLGIPVLPTLVRLHDACAESCRVISAVAAL